MGAGTMNIVLTVCLIGSSAAGYVYGLAISRQKSKELEKQLKDILSNPTIYSHARSNYLAKKIKFKDSNYSFNR